MHSLFAFWNVYCEYTLTQIDSSQAFLLAKLLDSCSNQTPFGNSAVMGFIAHQPCLQRTPSSLSSTPRDKVLSVIVS